MHSRHLLVLKYIVWRIDSKLCGWFRFEVCLPEKLAQASNNSNILGGLWLATNTSLFPTDHKRKGWIKRKNAFQTIPTPSAPHDKMQKYKKKHDHWRCKNGQGCYGGMTLPLPATKSYLKMMNHLRWKICSERLLELHNRVFMRIFLDAPALPRHLQDPLFSKYKYKLNSNTNKNTNTIKI